MTWVATHTVDVLTGTEAEDEYGDLVDASAEEATAAFAVPVSIRERNQRVYRADSQDMRVVRYLTGRAPTGTPVVAGDRLRDTTTGQTWVVDQVAHGVNGLHDVGLTLDLRAI